MRNRALNNLQKQLTRAGSTALASPSPDAIPPQSQWNRWIVIPTPEGQYIVGGISEATFHPYATFSSLPDVLNLLGHLEQPWVMPSIYRDPQEVQDAGHRLHQAVHARWMQRPGRGPAELHPGDYLDVFGYETGHRLIAAGTRWELRSQPPTDYQLPYHVYEVLQPLPGVQEGVAGPWFEQPGGAAMFITEHPIRWYLDHEYLQEVTFPTS